MVEQEQQERYQVATWRPQDGGTWRVHRKTFTGRERAERWVRARCLMSGRRAMVLPVVDGQARVPDWMRLEDADGRSAH